MILNERTLGGAHVENKTATDEPMLPGGANARSANGLFAKCFSKEHHHANGMVETRPAAALSIIAQPLGTPFSCRWWRERNGGNSLFFSVLTLPVQYLPGRTACDVEGGG